MKGMAGFLSLGLVLGLCGLAQASDPVGVYALIDKVVMEPADNPERVQLWGTFALAKKQFGEEYTEPAYGYLYFAIVQGKEARCLTEWNDLQKIAGTGTGVAIGSRYYLSKTPISVRKAAIKPAGTDPYPLGIGLTKLTESNYMVKVLAGSAAPIAPASGAQVPAGKVTLTARNIRSKDHKDAKYVFEIAGGGSIEKSTPVPAGDKETKWTPKLEVKAGEKYTWRVFATEGNWSGPVASADFTGKAAP